MPSPRDQQQPHVPASATCQRAVLWNRGLTPTRAAGYPIAVVSA